MIGMDDFAYCVPLLDIYVLISWMIDTRHYLLQAKVDVTYTC